MTSKVFTLPKDTLIKSFATFSLYDFIDDLMSPYMRMHAAKSYAWRIDTLIAQAARTLFKSIKEDVKGATTELDAEITASLAEKQYAEECFTTFGYDSASPVRTLHELLDIRDDAHDLAKEATSLVLDWNGRAMRYEIPDIGDVMGKVSPIKVKSDSLMKMKKSADRTAAALATGDEATEIAASLLAKKKKRAQMRADSTTETLLDQAGAVRAIFEIALMHRPAKLKHIEHFHQLHIETQRALIASCKQTLVRAEGWAEDDNSVTDEFDTICVCVLMGTKELDQVLATPRFNGGVATETPAPTVVAEQAKSVKQKKNPTPKKAPKATPAKTAPAPEPVSLDSNVKDDTPA